MSTAYRLYECMVCGFQYDEAEGWPPGRYRPRHPMGGHPRGLDLPQLRAASPISRWVKSAVEPSALRRGLPGAAAIPSSTPCARNC